MTTTREDIERNLLESRGYLAEIENRRKWEIRGDETSLISKLPFKAISIQESLVHRVADLTKEAIGLYDKDSVVGAVVLTRSVMETVALNCWLRQRIERVVSEGRLREIDAFLMKVLMGSRDPQRPEPRSYKIGKAIGAATKDFKNFGECYGELCEVVHPSHDGVFGSYGSLDVATGTLRFGNAERSFQAINGVTALWLSLKMFVDSDRQLSEQLPAFTSICEEDIKRQSNP